MVYIRSPARLTSRHGITIREAVHVPVILTGGVTKANEAEVLLEEGAADLIGVGRAIFKDADWAKKDWQNGKQRMLSHLPRFFR